MPKSKPLTPSMQDCLKRFGGAEFKLPHGKDIRTCEALWLRGLLKGELVEISAHIQADGKVLRNFRNAYRGADAARAAIRKAE